MAKHPEQAAVSGKGHESGGKATGAATGAGGTGTGTAGGAGGGGGHGGMGGQGAIGPQERGNRTGGVGGDVYGSPELKNLFGGGVVIDSGRTRVSN